MFLFWIL